MLRAGMARKVGWGMPATAPKTQPASQRNIATMPKTLVFNDSMCYTQFAFDLVTRLKRTITTQKKEGFIERVDITFLILHDFSRGRGCSQSLRNVVRRGACGIWEGNSLPLFLIALEKAVCL